MSNWRQTIIVSIVGFAAALLGAFAVRLLPPAHPQAPDLHDVLYRLDLDREQDAKITALERVYHLDKRRLENAMRSDNIRIAEAIEADHGDGPRVRAAARASHETVGKLQETTLAHVFRIRRLLRPKQAEHFDMMVAETLTADPRP